MRAPKRHRPRKDTRLTLTPDVDLEGLASRALYVISTEHKDYLTPAGPSRLRSDASACPREITLEQAQMWLKSAIRAGDVSALVEGEFPRYAWARIEDRVFEGRLTTRCSGRIRAIR